jgi:hypothetical protein
MQIEGSDKFIGVLRDIIDLKNQAARIKLTTQLTADIANLREFGDIVNGVFSFNPNADLSQSQSALEGTIQTLTELVELQTAAYKIQEAAIKARYEEEIKIIKDAHSEKYKEIQYTNELAEAEENVIRARRQLESLSISGASRGELREAQKNLEKLRQERDKIIEDEMVDQAQKELELEMQKELTTELGDLSLSIKTYTDQLGALITAVIALVPTYTPPSTEEDEEDDDTPEVPEGEDEEDDDPPPPPEPPSVPTGPPTRGDFTIMSDGMAQLNTSILGLGEEMSFASTSFGLTKGSVDLLNTHNEMLSNALMSLNTTIRDWDVRITNTTTTSASGVGELTPE